MYKYVNCQRYMWRGEGQWDQKSPATYVFSISSLSLNWHFVYLFYYHFSMVINVSFFHNKRIQIINRLVKIDLIIRALAHTQRNVPIH